MNKLWDLFRTFFKIGAFTFGGGWAMLPLMEREFVEQKGWIDAEDFVDIIALSQSFPGVLAVNSSTFIGHRLAGLPGALTALLGVSLPSILIILFTASFFLYFRSNPIVDLAMRGINSAVPALILIALRSLLRSVPKTAWNASVAALSSLLLIGPRLTQAMGFAWSVPRVHPVAIILIAAALGIWRGRKKEDRHAPAH
ncbi:Chromate transport protein [Clostridiaceae bacterium JG1575]|nr:Chromate transport protein [Clostridiaceae bacterium JG1575]